MASTAASGGGMGHHVLLCNQPARPLRGCSRPLRGLRPEVDTFDECPAASAAHLQHDPLAPTAVYANSGRLEALPERAVNACGCDGQPGIGVGPWSSSSCASSRERSRGRPYAPGALDRMDGLVLFRCVGIDQGEGWAAVQRGWRPPRGGASSTSGRQLTPTGCSLRLTPRRSRPERVGSSQRQARLKTPGPRWCSRRVALHQR